MNERQKDWLVGLGGALFGLGLLTFVAHELGAFKSSRQAIPLSSQATVSPSLPSAQPRALSQPPSTGANTSVPQVYQWRDAKGQVQFSDQAPRVGEYQAKPQAAYQPSVYEGMSRGQVQSALRDNARRASVSPASKPNYDQLNTKCRWLAGRIAGLAKLMAEHDSIRSESIFAGEWRKRRGEWYTEDCPGNAPAS